MEFYFPLSLVGSLEFSIGIVIACYYLVVQNLSCRVMLLCLLWSLGVHARIKIFWLKKRPLVDISYFLKCFCLVQKMDKSQYYLFFSVKINSLAYWVFNNCWV